MLDLDRQQLQYPFPKYRVPGQDRDRGRERRFTGRGGERLMNTSFEMVRYTQYSLRNRSIEFQIQPRQQTAGFDPATPDATIMGVPCV
jgi:hypothetical protein